MYGKHYESMYTGSMVGAGAVVFAVWGYVISHVRPPDYQLELNPKLLAFTLGEPEARVVEAINRLCSPDPASRSQDEEGRRLLQRGTYLFYVVNGASYGKIRSEEEKKAYWRDQKKRQRESIPEKVSEVSVPPMSYALAEVIYEAYPKHIGRPTALRAIMKAIAAFGYSFVLARTKLYAEARVGQDAQFTPLPATWFNQQRFNDDPATWKASIATNPNKPKVTTQADAVNRTMREIEQATQRAMKL